MTKVKKEGITVSQRRNSANGNRRSNGKLTPNAVREEPFIIPKVHSEAYGEELHWMADAAYNQSE